LNGDLKPVLTKISTIHAKNNFAFAIIAGELFGEPSNVSPELLDDLIGNRIAIPLPMYFALGIHNLPERIIDQLSSSEDDSVCTNLYFLGRRTTIKTSEGLRVVSLGGRLDASAPAGTSKDKYLPFHTASDAKILKGANSADILITTEWPSSVRLGSKVSIIDGFTDPPSNTHVADLCSALQPKYHFSTSPFFYEREPFFHSAKEEEPGVRPITRFISLATYNNPEKQKWLYAFTVPSSTPTSLPAGTTASPFLSSTSTKRSAPSQASFSRFSQDSYQHRPYKRHKQPPPGPGECFFCLSNPNLATHLITSIGDDAYLTISKGPLTTQDIYPRLGFPSPILIIPLTHSPTLDLIPDTSSQQSAITEMEKYRDAISSMISTKTQDELGTVTCEVSRATGIHAHWQLFPVSSALIKKKLVEAAFKVEAENLKYPSFEERDSSPTDSDFFRVWISTSRQGVDTDEEKPVGIKYKALLLPLDDSFRFDLQFGRRVLAKLLNLEQRLNWKDCGQSHEEEVEDAESFKKAFKEYDFASQEE
jgi:hypothetical protein